MLKKSEDGKIRVLSLSYGKDSIATIRACELLGYPLDRIVTADVWATQDIPADLPPMWEFKKKADKVIFDRWGIQVEHLCAMQRERERDDMRRERCCRLSYEDFFYGKRERGKFIGAVIGFPMQQGNWCNKLKTEKIDIRGYILSTVDTTKQDGYSGGVPCTARTTYGFPSRQANWCNSMLKGRVLDTNIRVPDYARKLVQQQPQTSGFTGSLTLQQGWDGAENSNTILFKFAPITRGR